MLDKKNKIQKEERAVLVGMVHKDQTEPQVHEYLDELAFLAETAGAVTVKRFTQKLPHPDSRTFVGKGKLEEIKKYVDGKDIRIVIFDDELTGAQINNIEKALDIKTIDRSDLILDIFARRQTHRAYSAGSWSSICPRWYNQPARQRETNGNAVFISALERRNIDVLRQTILNKVQEMYKVRYPYRTVEFWKISRGVRGFFAYAARNKTPNE